MRRRARERDRARSAAASRVVALALALAGAANARARAANAGGGGRPSFEAAVLPPSAFAGRTSAVTVHGLNFLPGRDAACADCNANGAATTRCAFGDARDNGAVSAFDGSDASAFECAVNAVDGATGTPRLGFARGSWSANGGYDWAVFGGESGGGRMAACTS